jgi:hypothetical protein
VRGIHLLATNGLRVVPRAAVAPRAASRAESTTHLAESDGALRVCLGSRRASIGYVRCMRASLRVRSVAPSQVRAARRLRRGSPCVRTAAHDVRTAAHDVRTAAHDVRTAAHDVRTAARDPGGHMQKNPRLVLVGACDCSANFGRSHNNCCEALSVSTMQGRSRASGKVEPICRLFYGPMELASVTPNPSSIRWSVSTVTFVSPRSDLGAETPSVIWVRPSASRAERRRNATLRGVSDSASRAAERRRAWVGRRRENRRRNGGGVDGLLAHHEPRRTPLLRVRHVGRADASSGSLV